MDQVTRTGRESAKQRSRRIPLDYHRQPTDLDRGKRRWTWIAALAGGIYVAWMLVGWRLGWPGAARQFSPAPLADVHAAWNGDCAACHIPGVHLRADNRAIGTLTALFRPGEKTTQQIAEQNCRACHAGPAHHDNQLAAEVVSCATCHQEHQGSGANLTRMADALCTSCHRDLERHRDREKKSVASGKPFAAVTDWRSHPSFRSIGGDNQASFVDPGRLRFNHALHMQDGQVAPGASDEAKWKWESIPEPHWPQLLPGQPAPADVTASVKLSCGSCHQLDDAPSGVQVPALGAYMQPIQYGQHCAGCHQEALHVDADRPAAADAKVSPLGRLPHALAPAEVRAAIAGMLQPIAPAAPLSPAQPLQPIPGKTPGDNLAQRLDDGPGSQLVAAETRLLEKHRCGKCHVFEEQGQDGLMPAVQPTAVPRVWLKHARFDHSAHRAMQCLDCHDAKQFAWSEETKTTALGQPPMIPNRELCAKCHGPTTARGATGARFDCVECHRYHGGALGPHGVGVELRGVPADRSPDLFRRMTGESSSSTTSSSATP